MKRLLLLGLFYFLSKCFSQSTPFVHSMKVLSWQFLLFDVEGIGAVCTNMCVGLCMCGLEGVVWGGGVELYVVLTFYEGYTGEGCAASGMGLGRGVDRQRGRMERRALGLTTEV